jgi:hypothetical protein
MFYIPNYDFYRTDSENGQKGGTVIAVKKRNPHICVTYPLSYQYKQQGSAYRLETLKCSLQLFINHCENGEVTDITDLLGFKNKSILTGDVNTERPVWNSKVSNPSYFKPFNLFVS